MSYGIKILGANNQIIHDSSESNVQFFAVGASGSLSPSNTQVSYNKETELLFLRPSSGYTIVKGNTNYTTTANGTFTVGTSSVNGNYVDYFKCVRTNNATQSNDAYGIEVLEADGTTVRFSSRRISSSVDIIRVWDDRQIGGSGNLYSNGQATILNGSSLTGTEFSKVYVSVAFMLSSGNNSWGVLTFNNTAKTIKYTSSVFIGNFGTSSVSLPNSGNVVIGKLTS